MRKVVKIVMEHGQVTEVRCKRGMSQVEAEEIRDHFAAMIQDVKPWKV